MAKSRTHLNYRAEGFRPQARPELAKEMAELRRSSATQPHTPKQYKGSRTANKRAAIRDYR